MSETARTQSVYALKPDTRHLVDFRREVLDALEGRLCNGYQQRLLFSVNEIVANLMRHSEPKPNEIRIDFETIDDMACCIVRDNGGSFAAFQTVWEQLKHKKQGPLFSGTCVGLSLVQCFCPNAYYLHKNGRNKYNAFVLPLVAPRDDDMPEFFRVKKAELVGEFLKKIKEAS